MKRRQDDGFSLVEVMVVVAIIGLMASVVVLSLPSKTSDMRQVVSQTERALLALSRSSVMSNRVIGVVFAPDGISTMHLTEAGWEDDDQTLADGIQKWPSLTALSLTVGGASQPLVQNDPQPHIWFLPTGEHPAFELVLAGDAGQVKISAAASSALKVEINE